MKPNTRFLFAVYIASFFLLIGCKKEQESNDKDDKFCIKYQGRPDIALTYGEIVALLQQYDETKRGALQAAHGKEDTRVNFFKIEDLKAYLAYVEKLSKDKKIKLTGINIISAAYPNDHKDERKRNYQTVILMPTTEIDGDNDVSFDPLNSEVGQPKTLAKILAKYGYFWPYDGKTKTGQSGKMINPDDDGNNQLSSGANRAGISPPL